MFAWTSWAGRKRLILSLLGFRITLQGDQYKPHHWGILKQDQITSVKEEPEWLQETGESRGEKITYSGISFLPEINSVDCISSAFYHTFLS